MQYIYRVYIYVCWRAGVLALLLLYYLYERSVTTAYYEDGRAVTGARNCHQNVCADWWMVKSSGHQGVGGEVRWVGFLVACFLYIRSIPTHEKLYSVGRCGPNTTFKSRFFLGWVGLGFGKFFGFIMVFTCFPTQQNL